MKIIISGAYAIGCHLARLLSREHEDIVVMDTDEERFSHIGSDVDILTMEASSTSIEALKNAGAEKADLFIAVTPDESKNMNSCVLAKALGTKKTVAKIDNAEYIAPDLQEFFSQLGVSKLIYPEMLAATDINNGLKMSWVRQRWDVHGGALVMLGVKLRETCTILDRPMREICGPEDPFHIVAIKRGDDTIIPGGNDCLQMYDLAYFMTTKQYIPYVRKIVGKEHYVDVKNVMIMGGGATAVRTVKTMPTYMDVKIIETDEQRCERLNSILEDEKALIINGDGRDLSLLIEEGIKNTQAFVALTGNAETNILACLTAKRMGVRKTVAMVENIDYVSMAESLDIGTIINKKSIAASHIYQMMLDANVHNVRFLMTANADVAEFIPSEGSKVTQKPVKDLGLPVGMTIGGLVRDLSLLIEEGIKNTQAFVALTGNAETNILACLTAKRMGVRKTVAMVENIDYVSMAESLDIGTIINKKSIAASHIYQMMLDANVHNVRFLMTANADVAEFIPSEGSKVTQKPVKDLGLPVGMTIGGLVRDGVGLLVSGNTMIQPGDSVMVFCHNVNMKKIEKFFL